MPKLEHDVAIYFDANFRRHEIQASSLTNAQVMADARKLELWDKTEQKRLQPRGGVAVRPHFYELTDSVAPRKLFEGEKNTAHDERVAELIGELTSVQTLTLAIGHKQGNIESHLEPLFILPNYSWESEVQRILSTDTIVRHDIFGQAPEMAMSVRFPWVAIEVINTHYPDEPAFAAMLKASTDYPLIVLFDFTDKPNRFLKVDTKKSILRIRQWSFYIKEGRLWKGNSATIIQTSNEFKNAREKMVLNWNH